MPTRLIREGIIDSAAVNSLTPEAEVFYRRLMNVADDHGRFDARPAVLRARLYPLKLDFAKEADVAGWLNDCVRAGLVVRYEVDGKPYLEICRFNQQIRSRSKYPSPAEHLLTDAQQMQSNRSADAQHLCTNAEAEAESNAESNAEAGQSAVRSGPPQPAVATDAEKPKTSAKSSPETSDAFARFWLAYPRKINKAAAWKAFKALNPSPNLLEQIFAALEVHKRLPRWTKDNGEFIPHPSSWINGRRWEDDVGPIPPAPVGQHDPPKVNHALERANRGDMAPPMISVNGKAVPNGG